MAKSAADGPIIIKKYANRRLYNTRDSAYVTLDDLATLVRDGIEFRVEDAKSAEDLTRSVLTQIIFEQEAKTGQNLLSTEVLRQLIQFYGHSMQNMVPGFLQTALTSFQNNQDVWANQLKKAYGADPVEAFQKQAEQNMAMFSKTLEAFNPFVQSMAAPMPTDMPKKEPSDTKSTEDVDDLKAQLDALQAQVDKISKR